ncbi:MAG: D-2-hydroxyacid dehydrogenase [Cytophagaceae bacterium]|nr:D-2-hydroxyacid dehydrogenase [Cytophagaceae bacterium]
MHIFIQSSLQDVHRQQLLAALANSHDLTFAQEMPENERRAAFQNAEIILGNPPVAWFDQPPIALKFWQLDSAGFDGYQHLKLSVPIANMGDWFAWPCAETIVAGIIGLYRSIHELAVLQKEAKWVGTPIRFRLDLLRHKRVLILGAGAIGQAVRKMLNGFDCDVKTLARTNPEAELHSIDELKRTLPGAQLVVNCLPGTAKGFFTEELIALMPPGSVYASVGRGSTTDEAALIAALQANRLAGAVLDVTEVEPLPVQNPLWAMPNVILTQHTGGGQRHENDGKADLFLKNLANFLANRPIENQIDLTRGY